MPAFLSTTRYCSRMLALSLLAAGLAGATVIGYNNPTDFTAALGPNSEMETFNGLPNLNAGTDSGYLGPLSFNPGVFSYSAEVVEPGAETGEFYSTDIGGGDIVLSTAQPDRTIVFTFTSGNVFAVGGYFWNTGIYFDAVPGIVVLMLDDSTLNVDLSSDGPTTFYGFVSDQPIQSLSVTPAAGAYATINDLYVADAPVADDTPEPGTVFAAVAGLAAIAFVRRRRFARS